MNQIMKIQVFPLWLRPSEVYKLFGLSRSYLYEIMEEGEVVTTVLKRDGNKRGIRLVSAESLNDYISKRANKPSPCATP